MWVMVVCTLVEQSENEMMMVVLGTGNGEGNGMVLMVVEVGGTKETGCGMKMTVGCTMKKKSTEW